MIKLPAIFTNHAVLQRDKEYMIWGESDAQAVRFSLVDENENIVYTKDIEVADGHFEASLEGRGASGPFEIFVENINDKDSKIILEDIYFGDVWIAGGQSNMELELQNSKDGANVVANANNPRVRFYYTPKVAWIGEELEKAEKESEWMLCNPESVATWSAVGYYFAQALTEEIEDVMIGIVGCNWGGTSASCWMSRKKLLEYPETKPYIDEYDKQTKGQVLDEYIKELEEYNIYQAEFEKNVGEYYQTHENPSWDEAISLFGENKYPGPMGPRNFCRPTGLYETMLTRIAPYTLMGAIFYQGENDDNRPYVYKRLLTSMVEEWREIFRDDKLAFVNTQLPIFVNEGEDDDKNWPFIREAQSQVSKEIGNGLAVILEAGEYHNIHPLDKETVGYRLAFQALHNVYGYMTKWEANGPEFESGFAEGNAYFAQIDCCEQGLMINGDDDFFTDLYIGDFLPDDCGFEIAGEDGVYYPAKAQLLRLDNLIFENDNSSGERQSDKNFIFDSGESYGLDFQDDLDSFGSDLSSQDDFDYEFEADYSKGSTFTLKLTSDTVAKPVFARYFWKNFGKVRVFGANGMPLAPFRSSMDDGAKALGSRQGAIIEKYK